MVESIATDSKNHHRQESKSHMQRIPWAAT